MRCQDVGPLSVVADTLPRMALIKALAIERRPARAMEDAA
jgi:hypothetical protein